jgi:hypothetical protein
MLRRQWCTLATTSMQDGRPAPALTLRWRCEGRPWYLVKQALKKAKITTGPLLAGRPDVGKFTKEIDAALHLGKAAALYQQLNSGQAAILAQLRTGMTSLNTYLYKIRAAETAECESYLAARIGLMMYS